MNFWVKSIFKVEKLAFRFLFSPSPLKTISNTPGGGFLKINPPSLFTEWMARRAGQLRLLRYSFMLQGRVCHGCLRLANLKDMSFKIPPFIERSSRPIHNNNLHWIERKLQKNATFVEERKVTYF